MKRTLADRARQTWFRISRPMTLGVRIAAIDDQRRILLVRHTYTQGFYLPGGGVDPGETCEAAAYRELEEEAGLTLQAPPELVGVYSNHSFFPNDHVVLYRAENWSTGDMSRPFEIAEHGFFDPRDPPESTTPATRRRIAEIFDGVPRSALW